MLTMSKLTEHYRQLLGLDASWEVSDVSLSLDEKRVEITLVHRGGPVTCPDCDTECSIADRSPERTWRHLDTMQFETVLWARTPRARCKTCGVKTTAIPWAGKHSRFTLMFEAFAIEVLLACGNVKSAAGLLDVDWNSLHRIMGSSVIIVGETRMLVFQPRERPLFSRRRNGCWPGGASSLATVLQ